MAIENKCSYSSNIQPGLHGKEMSVVSHGCNSPDRPKSPLSELCVFPIKQSECPWFTEKQVGLVTNTQVSLFTNRS